jgi:hypothetical protein
MQASTDNTTGQRGEIPSDTFPARLVLARHHAGRLSIEKASARCGLGEEGWRRWEAGANPRDKVEVAEAICEGLGIDRDWLLFGGPLTPAQGRLTKRTTRLTERYVAFIRLGGATRPIGVPATSTSAGARHRPELVDRSLQLPAAA